MVAADDGVAIDVGFVMSTMPTPAPWPLSLLSPPPLTLPRRFCRDSPAPFAASWNFFDAFLKLEHGADSPLYRMLRQAMMARRALLLLDGLDEGGQQRDQDRQKADGAAAPSELLAKVSLASVDFALDVRQRLGVRTEAMICAR